MVCDRIRNHGKNVETDSWNEILQNSFLFNNIAINHSKIHSNYVKNAPKIVASPICKGMEFDNPAALTPPKMKIWNSMSVKPATKVAPKRFQNTFEGAVQRLRRLENIESWLGGMKEEPRIRAITNDQINLHTIK